MIRQKPIFLYKYLGLKRNHLQKNVKRLFYLSWEDALWDILEKKQVIKNSIVLVPEFFCGDVEENIRNHGYRIRYYPVNSRLTTSPKQLITSIKKYNPKVLVILHPIGITNQLFSSHYWAKYLDINTILIEDCVHKIVDPSKLKFIKKNHFIIDSLRKVVPLQGSSLYGKIDDLDFKSPPFYQSIFYSIKVHYLWLLMNFFWFFKITNKARKTMKTGYDLIGDSKKPATGFFLFAFIQKFINIDKIKTIKETQVEFYEKNIKTNIPYSANDKSELMAYPIRLPLISTPPSPFDFELNDSKWSKKQKIIYLPLGPYLNNQDLQKIVEFFNKKNLL